MPFVAIPIGQLAVIPVASVLGTEQVAIWGALVYALAAVTPIALGSVRNREPDPPAQPA